MGRRETEKWVYIDLLDVKPEYYQISSWGRVKNIKGKLMSPDKDKDGYIKYTLTTISGKKRHFFGHRLVAIHFIPNPENKPEVNHLRPKNKTNLYYKYLEWCDHKENIKHSRQLKLQTILTCGSHGMATITCEDAERICKYMQDGLTNKEIIDKFGIKGKKKRERFRGVIKHIRARHTWIPISRYYKF